jgi:Secretion system C-terminal sorting domain
VLKIISITLLGIVLSVSGSHAQDLEKDFDPKHPVKCQGTLDLRGIGYTADGIKARRSPFSYLFDGNAEVNVYGVALPFAFTISDQQRDIRQPFNQFGISPKYKWVQVHLGYRNVTFSPYTLAGYTMLGVGAELTPGKFRFGFMYGRLSKATAIDTTTGTVKPYAFSRKGYAVKMGYGTDDNNVEISYLSAQDDSNSINKNIPDSLRTITPASNAVFGIRSITTFAKKFFIEVDGGASVYTYNMGSQISISKAYDDNLNNYVKQALTAGSSIISLNATTQVNFAYTGSIGYKAKLWSIKASYRHIDPEFQSMGWTTTSPTVAIIDPVFKFSTAANIKFVSTGDVAIYYSKGGCYAIQYVHADPSPMCIVGSSTVRCGCSCTETFTCASPGGTWSCSNNSIATISAMGVVSCHSEGSCDIIYTLGGCSVKKTIYVTSHDHHTGAAIGGTVTNNTGGSTNPEPYMDVNIIDPVTSNVIMTTTTDGSGNYTLTNVPDGNYIVSPTESGYTTTSSNVAISSSNLVAIVDFTKNTSSAEIAPVTNGVHSFTSDKGVNVYPNPTMGNLNIRWENQMIGSANVSVTDIAGREVFKSTFGINTASGQTSIDLSNLENGIYLITVKSENLYYNGRVQVVR